MGLSTDEEDDMFWGHLQNLTEVLPRLYINDLNNYKIVF